MIHTDSEKQPCAIFIRKLQRILNTPHYNQIISWDRDGIALKIFDFHDLQDEVLEVEFRHKNHKSFIRQLNMYGFKKLKKSTSTTVYFFHPLFKRDQEQNIHLIQRTKQEKRYRILTQQAIEKQSREIRQIQTKVKFQSSSSQNQINGFQKDQTSQSKAAQPSPNAETLFFGQKKKQNSKEYTKHRKTSIQISELENRRNSFNSVYSQKPHFSQQTWQTLKKSNEFVINKNDKQPEEVINGFKKLQPKFSETLPHYFNQNGQSYVNSYTPCIVQNQLPLYNNFTIQAPINYNTSLFVNPQLVDSQYFYQSPQYHMYQPTYYPQFYPMFR